MSTFARLKVGDLFASPDMPGIIWINCRGGFRPGRGGQLHSCQPTVPVTRITTFDPKETT